MIASNTALKQMIDRKPQTLEELKSCKLDGFYESKYLRFGNDFLKSIAETINSNNEQKNSKVEEDKQSTNNVWENDTIDADLSRIGDEVEKQLKSLGGSELEENNVESELDLLLADLQTVQQEINNEQSNCDSQSTATQPSATSYNILMLKNKPIYEYEDDSSDEDDSYNKKIINIKTHDDIKPETSSTHNPIQKHRVLPAWMQAKH